MMAQPEYTVAEVVFGFLAFIGRRRAMPVEMKNFLAAATRRWENAQFAQAVADGRGVLHLKETLRLASDHESI